ncbi:MAG: hypothetical protein NTY37_10455 [Methanothrix sp.]|nr:hypothetical protein [Methanothrix sp.]
MVSDSYREWQLSKYMQPTRGELRAEGLDSKEIVLNEVEVSSERVGFIVGR